MITRYLKKSFRNNWLHKLNDFKKFFPTVLSRNKKITSNFREFGMINDGITQEAPVSTYVYGINSRFIKENSTGTRFDRSTRSFNNSGRDWKRRG